MGSRGQIVRIDKELADMIRDTAQKNEMNMREASKELAKAMKPRIKETKITREIKF